MLRFVVYLAALIMIPLFAMASAVATMPSSVRGYIVDADLVGTGRMKYLAWDVYDASLYASRGKYNATKPIALSLYYLQRIKGRDIVDQSIKEMRYQGFNDDKTLAVWRKKMFAIIPDVNRGTILTGIMTSNGDTIFFKNGEKIGLINDPQFGRRFFNIWLGEKTSDPSLRKKLLGQFNSQKRG